MISFPRSALRWDVLPERGMWYLPALLLPFSLAPMTSFVWQRSQKATSICAALTAVCLPVSRLLPMSNSHKNPSHTCHQTHTFTNSPSSPLTLNPTTSEHPVPQNISTASLINAQVYTKKSVSVCELFQSFLFFPSNAVFSLPFTLLDLTAITQTSPFSPFVSALEAVNREPSVPLLVQVHCMQPNFMLVHLHASAHLTSR